MKIEKSTGLWERYHQLNVKSLGKNNFYFVFSPSKSSISIFGKWSLVILCIWPYHLNLSCSTVCILPFTSVISWILVFLFFFSSFGIFHLVAKKISIIQYNILHSCILYFSFCFEKDITAPRGKIQRGSYSSAFSNTFLHIRFGMIQPDK